MDGLGFNARGQAVVSGIRFLGRVHPSEVSMHKVYDNILQAVGYTPLVRLISVKKGLKCTLYAKIEYVNPGGSVKDRIALKIIEDAEKSGALQPGGTIIEGTSGNTGAGLAMAAAIKGYKSVFVLPDKQSEEEQASLRAWGARVVVTPPMWSPMIRVLTTRCPNVWSKNTQCLLRQSIPQPIQP